MDFTRHSKYEEGQTVVTLLFFMVMSIAITTAAVIMIVTNAKSQDRVVEGTSAYYEAEGGAENAMIRFLRDPSYRGEDNVAIGDGTASIVVYPNLDGTFNIVSIATSSAKFTRKVQVVAGYTNNVLSVSSWKEVY